ncbi:thioredoxin family protein [Echinicola pacifica]|nr:thioredoxin family protein [Echinicola pacifica]
MKNKLVLLLLSSSLLSTFAHAQASIRWMDFEQLEDSLAIAPKAIFIDFYTDWCSYCKKMDKEVFTKPEVVQWINNEVYAVRMDAESRDNIYFDGRWWKNRQATAKREGFHELALLLGSRQGEFVPPVFLLLDEQFTVIDRKFQYLSSEKLMAWLRKELVNNP